ncbi:aldehyde dehydrogenase family protein [Paracoccus versutus]|nr:aldehyde dehydrogenase family protein [Paracoccus versutus]
MLRDRAGLPRHPRPSDQTHGRADAGAWHEHAGHQAGRLGLVIFARQAEILRTQLDNAVAKGARIPTGGRIIDHESGLWCEPTVLADVTQDMAVMRDETFGPHRADHELRYRGRGRATGQRHRIRPAGGDHRRRGCRHRGRPAHQCRRHVDQRFRHDEGRRRACRKDRLRLVGPWRQPLRPWRLPALPVQEGHRCAARRRDGKGRFWPHSPAIGPSPRLAAWNHRQSRGAPPPCHPALRGSAS